MALIGSLVVGLGLESGKFQSGLAKSSRDLKSWRARTNRSVALVNKSFRGLRQEMKTGLRGFVSWRAGIGALAGTAGFGLLIKKSLEAADAIGKTADRLGLSTSAFQELQFVAGQSGVKVEQFNVALTALVRRQGEAIRGNKSFAEAFADIGISVAELRGLNTEQLLNRVADALGGIENQALRVAAADRVMSEAGRQVINVFDKSAAGMEALRREARELGLVIDEQLIRNAESASDKLDVLGKVIKVKVTSAVVGLAPEIGFLADAFVGLIGVIPVAGDKIAQFFNNTHMISDIDALESRLGDLNERLRAINTRITATRRVLGRGATVEVLVLRKADLEADAQEVAARINALKPQDSVKRGSVVDAGAGAGIGKQTIAGLELPGFDKKGETLRKLRGQIKSASDAMKGLGDSEALYRGELNLTLTGEDARQGSLRELRKQIDAYGTGQLKVNRVLERSDVVFNTLADSMDSAMTSAIRGQIQSWRDLGDAAVTVLRDIGIQSARTFFAMQSGGTGNLFSGLLNLVGFGGARVDGGPVSAGRTFLVGEEGPELFTPRASGTVLPAGATAGATAAAMGGGVTINQTINVQTGVAQTVRAEMMALAPRFQEAAIAGVREAQLRGGRV